MRVSEIFASLQGEGPNIGQYVTFVRLYGCNLHCSFCDTKYASDDGNTGNGYVDMTPEEVASAIKTNHVVWTGGEPLLQQEEIEQVIRLRDSMAFINDLETNGTIIPTRPTLFDTIVVSPKSLELVGPLAGWLILSRGRGIGKRVWFKFPCKGLVNVENAAVFVRENNITQYYVMPITSDGNEMKEHEIVASVCIANKMSFSPRLHKLINMECFR